MIFYRNLREITFRLTNVIPERIIFVSRGITVYVDVSEECSETSAYNIQPPEESIQHLEKGESLKAK